MFRFIILLVGILSLQMLSAQTLSRQVLATAGSNHPELSSTTGEAVVETVVSGSFILTQGFQQEYDTLSMGLWKAVWLELNYVLYPNPASDRIFLELETDEPLRLQLHVVDLQGRQLRNMPLHLLPGKNLTELAVSDLAVGDYVIQLLDTDYQQLQGIRFRKIH